VVLWKKHAKGKFCTNHNLCESVQNQLDCQHQCKKIVGCVGYAFGDPRLACMACLDDVLSAVTPLLKGNDFYRRPKGNDKFLLHTQNKYVSNTIFIIILINIDILRNMTYYISVQLTVNGSNMVIGVPVLEHAEEESN
jgi:hypothetical protein